MPVPFPVISTDNRICSILFTAVLFFCVPGRPVAAVADAAVTVVGTTVKIGAIVMADQWMSSLQAQVLLPAATKIRKISLALHVCSHDSYEN